MTLIGFGGLVVSGAQQERQYPFARSIDPHTEYRLPSHTNAAHAHTTIYSIAPALSLACQRAPQRQNAIVP